MITRAIRLNGVCAHDADQSVAMDHAVAKGFGQKLAYVEEHAGGRAWTSVKEVGHNTRVVLMPFVKDFGIRWGSFGLGFRPSRGPAFARRFVHIAVIAVFHDVVDAHPAVAIVVIVRLPQSAK